MKKYLLTASLAIPLLGALKKRRIIGHLSGRTEQEARDIILSHATPRVGREKAETIADRIVTGMTQHGLLNEPAAG